LYNVVSRWLYLKEYTNDTRSHERQNYMLLYNGLHVTIVPYFVNPHLSQYYSLLHLSNCACFLLMYR